MKRMIICVATAAMILTTSVVMADTVFVKKGDQLLVATVTDSINISPECQNLTLAELTNILSGQIVLDTVDTYWKVIKGFPIIQAVDAMDISRLGLSEDGREIIQIGQFTAENEPVNWYWVTSLMWLVLIGLGISFALMPSGPRNRLAIISFILMSSLMMASSIHSAFFLLSPDEPMYSVIGQIFVGILVFLMLPKKPIGLYAVISIIAACYYNSIVIILCESAIHTKDYFDVWVYVALYCLILLTACGIRESRLLRFRSVPSKIG